MLAASSHLTASTADRLTAAGLTGIAVALGIGLVVLGLSRRRPQQPEVVREIWGLPVAPGLPAEDPRAQAALSAPPPEPAVEQPVGPSRGGVPWMVLGVVLAVVGLVGGITAALSLHHDSTTDSTKAKASKQVTYTELMPTTLLGKTENTVTADAVRSSATTLLPTGLTTDVLAYGVPTQTIVLIGLGDVPASTLGGLQAALTADGSRTLSNERSVDVGSLGGQGSCWDGHLVQVRKDTQVCAFTDSGSVVVTFDFAATSTDAAQRAVQVREAVLQAT